MRGIFMRALTRFQKEFSMFLFSSVSFSRRLYLVSFLLILCLVGVVVSAWRQLSDVRELTHRTGNVKVLQLSLIASTELKVSQSMSDVRQAMLAANPQEVDLVARAIQQKRAQISQNDADFLKEITTQAGRDAFKRDWLDLQEVSWPVAEKNLRLIQAGRRDEALAMLRDTTTPQFAKIQKWLSEERDRQTKVLGEDVGAIGSNVDSIRLQLSALVSVVAVGLVAFSLYLARALRSRVAQAQTVADRVAAGDFSLSVSDPARDEFSPLLAALASMQSSLTGVVAQVRANALSVATASSEIAQGNQDLSQRTEEQASALQQTSASMTEIGSMVSNNTESAQLANQLARNASSVAVQGGDVVGQVVVTMQGISNSSKKIGDIIGVIDGIAFQTNILALNAAVEAARAGEQGRGFAVVAGEVRTLAQRSAEAAKEIKTLIGHSVEQVEQGSVLVDRAGKTMADIVDAIKRVSDLVAEISSASAEQSLGVQQVGTAIGQMDQVTQQNAALVEQSAAAAESLKVQAQYLVDAVAVFKLVHGGIGGSERTPVESVTGGTDRQASTSDASASNGGAWVSL